MATIERYETKAGPRYAVRYRKPDRKQSTKRGFTTKRDARLWAADNEVSQAAGTFIDPALTRATIGTLGTEWLQRQTHLKPSSLRPLRSAWTVHVKPRWGDYRIGAVRTSEVADWVSGFDSSPTTVIRAYGVLAGIIDDAVKDRRIPSNPARLIDNLPRKQRSEHIYLDHKQVEALAEAADPHALIIRVLAYCGLRWGEISGLRVKDVNPLRRRFTIAQNAVEVGSKVIVGTPKNHERRQVPYPAFLASAIEQQCKGKTPEAILFPGRDGGHMRRPNTGETKRSWLKTAIVESGVPPLTVHALRHTAASLAVQAGANVKALQRMLGHASAAMTLDVYSDLFDDDLDVVAEALDRARSAAV